jgi:CubicO group peptidase (beta-lactamase class C family)
MTHQSLLHFAEPHSTRAASLSNTRSLTRLLANVRDNMRTPVRRSAWMSTRVSTWAFATLLAWAGAHAGNVLAQASATKTVAPTSKPALNLDGNFAENIDRHLQTLASRGLFSGSVLVARGDKVVLSKGYGFSSVELQVPNTPNTTFRIASVTKQFTAAAVLLLADRKKLSLADPISKHFSNLPDAWKNVTVRQLLDHTSGIPSYTDFVDLRSFALTSQSPQTIMALSAEKPMNFAPGAGFSYNNTAYVMAGWLIERVSGKTYAEFIEEDVLAPIGIKNSGYAFHDRVIPQRAQNYTEDSGKVVNAQYLDMSVPYSAGAMYATTLDLHRWNRALYGGKLLTKESLAMMVDGGKHQYGLGIGVRNSERKEEGGLVYSHSGGMPGVRTMLIYEPASELTVAVLGNLDTAAIEDIAWLIRQYGRDRSRKLAHQYNLIAPATNEAAIFGRYGTVPNNKDEQPREAHVRLLDGVTHFVPSGSGPLKLLPVAPFRYVDLAMMEEFNFMRDRDGKVVSIETNFAGKPITLKRLPPQDLSKQVIYLRGTMNSWGTVSKLTALAEPNRFSARVKLTAGAHGFKLATEDWRTIDLGAASQSRDNVAVGKPFTLAPRGTNLRLWVDNAGEHEFVLDTTNADAATVTVRAVSGK